MSSSIFSKIASAEALTNSTYFTEGQYIVEILDAIVKENRHGLNVAIIECRVEKCSNPKVRVGSTVSWICRIQGSDVGPRDLKTQFCGIVNCRPAQVTAEILESSFTPDVKTGVSPLAGVKCYVYAHNTVTQKGGTFTKVEFRGLQDNQPVPDFEQAVFVEPKQEAETATDEASGGNLPF